MPQSSVRHQDGRQRMDGSILGRHPPLPDKIQRSISKQRQPSPLGRIPWFRLSTCEIQPDQTEIIYCISSISTPTYTQSIPTIAAELKYSSSTVRRGIRDLKKAGLLETEQRYKKRRQEQFAVPAESEVKKAKSSAKVQLRLQADRCHLSWWKEKVNYPTEE